MGDEKQAHEEAQQAEESRDDLELPEETAEQVKGGLTPNKKMPSKIK